MWRGVVGAGAGHHAGPVADRLDDGAEQRSFSSSVVVGDSPVVPLITRPSLPWSTRWVARRWAASRSSAPSAVNGVTIAVSTRPKAARQLVGARVRCWAWAHATATAVRPAAGNPPPPARGFGRRRGSSANRWPGWRALHATPWIRCHRTSHRVPSADVPVGHDPVAQPGRRALPAARRVAARRRPSAGPSAGAKVSPANVRVELGDAPAGPRAAAPRGRRSPRRSPTRRRGRRPSASASDRAPTIGARPRPASPALAGQHDVAPAGQRPEPPRQRLPGGPAHHDRRARGERA